MTAGISQMSSLAKCGVQDLDVVINFFTYSRFIMGQSDFQSPKDFLIIQVTELGH